MDQSEKRKFEQPTPYPEYGLDNTDKRRRVVGPTLPLSNPADDDTLDSNGENESSDDDDIGPCLPPSGPMETKLVDAKTHGDTPYDPLTEQGHAGEDRSHRDEWMLQPPGSSGRTARVDPTKLRSRKFQSGRSASNSQSGEVDSSWTETPEQKMKRLQDKVMGVSIFGANKDQVTRPARVSQAMQDRIQKYNDAKRKENAAGNMLQPLEECKNFEEDDASSRPFDKEKDMAISSKITNSQRREMINRAADFGSRFSKGNYL
ncbi:hypothetical protein COH20_012825 [Aspergillus flavus]|nr:uncharacterized protein G4B84_011673 [Aspergillus flavus NRRL3357]EIT83237.1 hypothetical protein Ao3042_13016 [Aspergillus oryzae 3.042]KAJ1706719.1 hypothetical protein NYO67_11114 [Aspergillus flavus]KOC14813.1 hypothetical protein AFLA70_922g000091 [Aspergillus flavus AF70]OOO07903.1 Protein of unknown function DUF3752 [Aspergillus oryzae]QMW36144.1 hypothetical protein G4B84_011673 [Aspergillus flavus NRRL3357]|eukprot:EIT83237.1 hypothetical protein Ao3042_13016 [Aspergillus oryzae 3.042]